MVKLEARVVGVFPQQLGEKVDRFRALRPHRLVGSQIAGNVVVTIALAVDRLKHRRRPAPALDDKVAHRAELTAVAPLEDSVRYGHPGADRLVEAFESRAGVEHVAE